MVGWRLAVSCCRCRKLASERGGRQCDACSECSGFCAHACPRAAGGDLPVQPLSSYDWLVKTSFFSVSDSSVSELPQRCATRFAVRWWRPRKKDARSLGQTTAIVLQWSVQDSFESASQCRLREDSKEHNTGLGVVWQIRIKSDAAVCPNPQSHAFRPAAADTFKQARHLLLNRVTRVLGAGSRSKKQTIF